MDDLMRRQLLAELRRAGYHEAHYSQEHDAVLPMDTNFPGIQMHDRNITMPRLESPPHYVLGEQYLTIEEREEQQRSLVYAVFRPIADKVDEMTGAWNRAPLLEVDGLDEKYRLLSEYGKILLAARDDGARGLHFVTWEYSYDRTGVNHGHYTTDYEGAKRDFAMRAGLISPNLLFEPEELKQIHSALLFQGKNDDELTFNKERDLLHVIQKLEDISPGLKDTQEQTPQESEPEPEL